ncbi:MAG TPA: methionine adenosyltransferase [Mollicutes bacterium]|nr:methionine adenosyltransferase [Mollicutes bacterium]
MKKLFTSESVTCGHPDKICDQISDAILDAYLEQDKNARVACEVCVSSNMVIIIGEITSEAEVDIESIARKTIIDIGYDNDDLGFNGYTCQIITNITKQSPDIALGVNVSLEEKKQLLKSELGAGDQGIMFGYACDETATYMPLAIQLAHALAKRLELVRKERILPYLSPDGKTQVTVEYVDGVPTKVKTIVVSAQHNSDISISTIEMDVINNVINKVVPKDLIDDDTNIFVNPTGQFIIGGPVGDSGLTGRKIIVDTYGGYAHHGGGAFSGKDYTKVDRTASYYARYVAKNIVAAGLAKKCEIQVSYAIGVATPVSIFVNTFNTSKVDETEILKIINNLFDFKPSSMIEKLKLKNPIYQQYASYGHFGRDDVQAPWEEMDMVDKIKEIMKNN